MSRTSGTKPMPAPAEHTEAREIRVHAADPLYREWIEKVTGERAEEARGDERTPSWFVPDARPLPTTAQAFVAEDSDGAVAGSFQAVPYRKQYWPGAIPALRVGRLLSHRKTWDAASVRDAIVGVKALARNLRVSLIELEIYKSVWGPIFFPSSPAAMNTCNDPELAIFLGREKVPLREVLSTVEVPLEAVQAAGGDTVDPTGNSSPSSISVRAFRAGDESDRDAYYRLWSESGEMPADLGGGRGRAAEPGVTGRAHAGGWRSLRPWYSDVSGLLALEDYILLAEIGGQAVGLLHWWPNVFRIDAEHGPSGIHCPAAETAAIARSAEEAKIFKLTVAKAASRISSVVTEALLRAAFRTMAGDYGLRKAHISGLRLYAKGADLSTGGILNRLSGRTAEVVQEVVVFNFKP